VCRPGQSRERACERPGEHERQRRTRNQAGHGDDDDDDGEGRPRDVTLHLGDVAGDAHDTGEGAFVDHRRGGDHDVAAFVAAGAHAGRHDRVERLLHLRPPRRDEVLTDVFPIGVGDDGTGLVGDHDPASDVRGEPPDVAGQAVTCGPIDKAPAVEGRRDRLGVAEGEGSSSDRARSRSTMPSGNVSATMTTSNTYANDRTSRVRTFIDASRASTDLSGWVHEAESDAAHRRDVRRVRGVVLDLLPQPRDVHVERLGGTEPSAGPTPRP